MRIKTAKPEKDKLLKTEVSVAHFIPYKCHWNSNTILTYDEKLIIKKYFFNYFAFEIFL